MATLTATPPMREITNIFLNSVSNNQVSPDDFTLGQTQNNDGRMNRHLRKGQTQIGGKKQKCPKPR